MYVFYDCDNVNVNVPVNYIGATFCGKSVTKNLSKNLYTINYDLKGGSVSSANPTQYDVETPDITLNNPTRDGYTFTGWTGSNGNSPQTSVKISKGSTENRSYTANWSPINYNITFDLNGGAVTGNPNQYNVETADITLSNPTRAGYTFTGWLGTDLNEKTDSVTIPKGSTGNRWYIANWEKEDTPVTTPTPDPSSGGSDFGDENMTTNSTTSPKSSKLSTGEIVGIVIGAIATFIGAIGGGIAICKGGCCAIKGDNNNNNNNVNVDVDVHCC